jgi:hypothetical protein
VFQRGDVRAAGLAAEFAAYAAGEAAR